MGYQYDFSMYSTSEGDFVSIANHSDESVQESQMNAREVQFRAFKFYRRNVGGLDLIVQAPIGNKSFTLEQERPLQSRSTFEVEDGEMFFLEQAEDGKRFYLCVDADVAGLSQPMYVKMGRVSDDKVTLPFAIENAHIEVVYTSEVTGATGGCIVRDFFKDCSPMHVRYTELTQDTIQGKKLSEKEYKEYARKVTILIGKMQRLRRFWMTYTAADYAQDIYTVQRALDRDDVEKQMLFQRMLAECIQYINDGKPKETIKNMWAGDLRRQHMVLKELFSALPMSKKEEAARPMLVREMEGKLTNYLPMALGVDMGLDAMELP